MKVTLKTWELYCFLQIAILQSLLVGMALGSVLPRPNIRQRSTTTQISRVDKNYSGQGTIVIVTSSELPKQIPPPPTPTKPHTPTPKYDVTSSPKEFFYNRGLHDKELFQSFRIPYEHNLNSFHNYV